MMQVPCRTCEEQTLNMGHVRLLTVTKPATIRCNATVFWLYIYEWQLCSVMFYFYYFFVLSPCWTRNSLGMNQGGC